MTRPLLLSRPFSVATVGPEPVQASVTATADECAAIAKADRLPGLAALSGAFAISRVRAGRYAVTGTVRAHVTQMSVVSLEPFETDLEEPVDVIYAEDHGDEPDATDAGEVDPLIDGTIDLGALTAEFLALGLDPYPRKPGEIFETPADGAERDPSPFAGLSRLLPKTDG